MKMISIVAYNRPKCLDMLFSSLAAQYTDISSYKVLVSVDVGGSNFDEMVRMSEDFGAIVLHPSEHLGMNKHTHEVTRQAFEVFGAEHVVYLEEDFLLSPDAFALIEWYLDNRELLSLEGDIASYCLCTLTKGRPDPLKSPDAVYLSRKFCCWGLLIDEYQWYRYFKPGWFAGQGSWDKLVARYIRTFPETCNVFPVLSRASNTGKYGGHSSSEKYREMLRDHKYNQSLYVSKFNLTGEPDA